MSHIDHVKESHNTTDIKILAKCNVCTAYADEIYKTQEQLPPWYMIITMVISWVRHPIVTYKARKNLPLKFLDNTSREGSK